MFITNLDRLRGGDGYEICMYAYPLCAPLLPVLFFIFYFIQMWVPYPDVYPNNW